MFEIKIKKSTNTSGTLTFNSGAISVNSPCWFAETTPVAAGRSYTCAATRMDHAKDSVTGEPRPGIFFQEFGDRGIFIHEGQNVTWSKNCVVLPRPSMMEMWNHIIAKGQLNRFVINVIVG